MKRHAMASPLRSVSGTPSLRTLWSLVSACAFGVVALLAVPSPAAAACPNEAFRTGSGSHLPDCRAYEQVSPLDKNNGNVSYGPEGANASPMLPSPAAPDGDRVAFTSFVSFAGNPSAPMVSQYLSSREAAGWSTQAISPPKLAPWVGTDTRTGFVSFAEDLSNMTVVNWAAPGQFSLFWREPDGTLTLLKDGTPVFSPDLAQVTPDYSHFLVSQNETGARLYLWSGGQVEQVTGAGGAPATGGAGASSGVGGFSTWGRAISDDGSRIFWTPAGGVGGAARYLYEDGTQTNYVLSRCTTGKVGEPGPGGNCVPFGTQAAGGADFWTSTVDGEALFISKAELTNDANTGTANQGADLYRYGTDGVLTDLTADPDDPNGAEVQFVLDASDDGAYLYFIAKGVLAEGATAGQLNVYAWHEGETTFAGAVAAGEDLNWSRLAKPVVHSSKTQVSADGSNLVFTSKAPTGQVVPGSTYDNAGHDEIYLFDADAGEIFCLSCDPSGAAAEGDASLGRTANGPPAVHSTYRNVSPDGSRVFFETTDALLPQDVNGVSDVYQWQRAGTGTCEGSGQDGGCVSLISTGRSPVGSFFQGMGASGDDAFFITAERLVGQDTDDLFDLYDARVGGGLAGQFPPVPAPPCLGESCRGEGSGTRSPLAPGTALTVGGGNAPPDCSSFAARARRLEGNARDLRQRAGLLRRLAARTEGARRTRGLRGRASRLEAGARGRDKRAQVLTKRAKQCRAANGGTSK